MTGERVLVTGGTGFLAGWCVKELARRGYEVRTTVRDPARADQVRAALGVDRLTVLGADLDRDDGWTDAVRDCAYVLHVASPFPAAAPKNPDDVIRPARDGALRVLGAALDADVSRVVLTSSSTTMQTPGPLPLDETRWRDPDAPRTRAYVRSKIIAERAAWDLATERDARARLVTVAPTAMLGPVFDTGLSYSMRIVSRMLDGAMPGLPRLGFSLVDVRDVAVLHLSAMTTPAAGGRRFVADAGFRWLAEIAAVLRCRLGSAAAKVPTRRLPDFVVCVAALFDNELRQVVGDLGTRTDFTTTAARDTLSWQPRAINESIVDSATSLLRRHAVKFAEGGSVR